MKNLRLITSLVICVCAIATIVVNVRSCRSRAAVQPPPEPLSAAERTQARIRERMSDPSYTNGLAVLADKRAELVSLRNEAAREFESWCGVFVASNAEARVVFDQIQALLEEGRPSTNAAVAAKAAEFEALVAADPKGKYLLDKRDKIAEAMAEHERVARAFIGGRAYRQMREHAGEERDVAERQREKLIAEGRIKPPPPPPPRTAPTNMPPPRQEGWWTNAASASAAVEGRQSKVESPAEVSSSGKLTVESGK